MVAEALEKKILVTEDSLATHGRYVQKAHLFCQALRLLQSIFQKWDLRHVPLLSPASVLSPCKLTSDNAYFDL